MGTDVSNDFIFGPLHTALRARLAAGIGTITGALPIATQDEVEAPLAVQSQSPRAGFFPFNEFSTLPLLLDAARRAQSDAQGIDSDKRLMIVPGCHVIMLHLDRNERVNRIQTTLGDVAVRPNAVVIIALGTIESTRLALLSFPNRTGRIGGNLMAHLRSNTTVRFPRTALGPGLPAELEASALFVKGMTPNGHFHLQITACGVRGDVSDSEAEHFKKIPDIDQIPVMAAALQTVPDDYIVATIRGIGEMESEQVPAAGAHSRVEPDPELDENGVQRVKVTVGLTQRDLDLWDDMDMPSAEAAALAGAAGAPDLRYLNEATGQWQSNPWIRRDSLGSTHHESGTLWMGADPNLSVTDLVGRFHEVRNAYAVGPALFPTMGSPNPMLGGTALLRRTAEWLVPPDVAPVVEAGFTSLFDGTSTANWQMAGPGTFVLEAREHGVMTSQGGPGLLWYTPRPYADFVLRLEWQAAGPDDNSGVFIRFPNPGNDPGAAVRDGLEVQIDDRGRAPDGSLDDPLLMTGAVYSFSPAQTLASRLVGEWNALEITAQGQLITVVLNGEVVVDKFSSPRRADGHVGVQNHGGNSRVAFRNIRIKELP